MAMKTGHGHRPALGIKLLWGHYKMQSLLFMHATAGSITVLVLLLAWILIYWHGAKISGERKRVVFCSLISFATAIGHPTISSIPFYILGSITHCRREVTRCTCLVMLFVWRDHSRNDMIDLLRDPAHKMSDGKILPWKAGEENRNLPTLSYPLCISLHST